MKVSRVCNVCGCRCFAPSNCPCPQEGCHGIMCQVIPAVPGKRLAGFLYRDKSNPHGFKNHYEVTFSPMDVDPMTMICGVWTGLSVECWSAAEWKEQYGKLPRKGSKTAVILELTHDE